MITIIPFIGVILFFIIYIVFLIYFIPSTLEIKGQFGDSFGAINALFTGLGFAGLLTTIALQLQQSKKSQNNLEKSFFESSVRSYEETLFRLLELYQKSIDAIIQGNGQHTTHGLSALRQSCDHLCKKISADKGNIIPYETLKNYSKNNLTDEDKKILNDLIYINFKHINFSFNRQGKFIESFKTLINHLEKSGPDNLLRDNYRKIILSQLTYIETQYIFYICLGVKNEDELRDLVNLCGLSKKFNKIHHTKIQKIIYKNYWEFDITNEKLNSHELPKNLYTIKKKKNNVSDKNPEHK